MNGWRRALVIAAGIWLALLALTPWTTLWDRDEPRFAQAAVEMLRTGDYLVPTFNGEVRAQKPPLIYWLMTLSMRVLGPTEFAARFWSPAAMAIAALATFAIGRRLWSAAVGHRAMLVLALTPLTILEGVAATTDAVLLATLTCAVACGLRILHERSRPLDVLGLGAALGAGLLVKGPLAAVIVLPVLAAAAIRLRREDGRLFLPLTAAALGGGLIYFAWLLPATMATDGLIASRGLVRENLGRFLTAMEGHGTPLVLAPFYYPAVIAIGFLPWTRSLVGAFRLVREAPAPDVARPLLAAWALVPVVVFTIAATKLPHYILPIWPALALAVAVSFNASESVRWPRLATHALVTAVVLLVAVGLVAPVVERQKPVPIVAAALRHSGLDGPVYAFGFDEPSLVFYAQRRLETIGSLEALRAWIGSGQPATLVTTRDAAQRAEQSIGPLGLRELAAAAGWNYATGDRLELVAFVRGGGR
jgi:4-amino-4-deoxy-L-arabinose transferase-like glycosyltransferase